MRFFEIAPANADAQRVKQLKGNAKRAQKTAQIAQQQATIKKAQEKLAKARQTPAVPASL
jgi:hypothetical protein